MWVESINVLGFSTREKNGMYLCSSKCRIWWPSAPSHEAQSRYPSNVPREHDSGTCVLKAPIGRQSFVEESFIQHVQSLKTLFHVLQAIEDCHVSLQLLKSCMGVCKVLYLLRVLSPSETVRGSILFDKMVETTLRAILEGVLDNTVFRELQLPTKMPTGSPSFGVGLTSAATTAAAAHLASASLTQKLCTAITHTSASPPTALSTDPVAADANARWTS